MQEKSNKFRNIQHVYHKKIRLKADYHFGTKEVPSLVQKDINYTRTQKYEDGDCRRSTDLRTKL